ncbi:hypothetical protein B0F90DRAFT_876418 [Multifurca ochricompacta]|uniref:Uncharacterized protein n=1 Tax=Multifurca ochricompacta TaxID=376703 RepID=A0AAD4QGH0_9AGAM|nr:hypothetical protein B0F90DRAFT_876418 [Multifurca ochricompacta]
MMIGVLLLPYLVNCYLRNVSDDLTLIEKVKDRGTKINKPVPLLLLLLLFRNLLVPPLAPERICPDPQSSPRKQKKSWPKKKTPLQTQSTTPPVPDQASVGPKGRISARGERAHARLCSVHGFLSIDLCISMSGLDGLLMGGGISWIYSTLWRR